MKADNDMKKLFNFIMMFMMPILLWMYIFKSFLNGSITLMKDTYAAYSMFKFFYNNLFNGVVPMWDPFIVLGVPNVFIVLSGVLSPFMAFFGFLHFLGINYYASFILFILFYFILGLTGFYLLVFEILEDRFLAWLAFIALLFSGMGPMLFNQIYIYFIFCPAVWMFYFLFRFFKSYEKKFFFGIIITLMNMLCFYYPFYFITLFLFFIVLFTFFYPARLMDMAGRFKHFIIQNKKMFFSGILFIIFALLPMFLFKINLNGGDILFLCRHDNIVLSENALDKMNSAAMTFDEVSLGGTLGERMKGGRLFSHLDKYDYLSDDFFYIPVLIYTVIFITALVPFGRRQFFILCLGLSILILSLGQVAPLHRILFDLIYYFKYFRNFFFFMGFFIPIVILFAMFQLKELFNSSWNYEKRWQNIIVNTFLHLYFFSILLWHGNILITTYITVFVSCIAFNLLFLKPNLLKAFIFLILILEPIQVFASYEANSLSYQFSAPDKQYASFFSYKRPSLTENKPYHFFDDRTIYGNFWYDLALKDSKGYVPDKPITVSKYTYLLSKKVDKSVFLDYIRNKFYIYDKVKILKSFSKSQLEEVFRKNENLAFVSGPWEKGIYQNSRTSEAPLIPSGDSAQFKVVDFDPNHLQLITNFNTGKFLVYTDSYEKYWKVFINKHEQKLYRANWAFKGVWLPAGMNKVDFQYSVIGEKELYLLLLLINFLCLVYFVRLICIK